MYYCIIVLLGTSLVNTAVIPPRNSRLSIVDWNNYYQRNSDGPGTYAFGYDVEDVDSNNIQFRNEEKLANGSVVGSYGYLMPDGNVQMVNYIADALGYRATVETTKQGTLKRNSAPTFAQAQEKENTPNQI